VLSAPITTGRDPAQLSLHDRLTISLLGVDLANVTLIVLAVLAVTGELASGQIALTLQVTPNRSRVVMAKFLVVLAVAAATSVVATVLAFVTGQLALLSQGVALPSVSEPGLVRLVLGTTLMIPVHVVFATALSICLRSGSLAFVAVFAIMCLPSLVNLLPPELAAVAHWFLPGSSLHTVSGASVPGDPDYTAVWVAVVVVVGWLAGLVTLALRCFRRRDV
jgi:ABC-2 type transport system permease protein